MNGAGAPENRVRVLRRALMYFGGVGLSEAKFRFIWPYHARPAEVRSPVNPGHDAHSRTERLPFYNPSKESCRWTKS
jgi:hypothetical protein